MEYRVLARKYRPTVFADLIGQEVLVRTLENAIASGRLHHAFVLTGIRGVGKTTTARLVARALNCESGPTTSPCGTCSSCRMIGEDRHPDVLEMDAASRTGVDSMRELLETVHYAPVAARYKIYIIDEVHMLSTSAFNALLKTLEEPPPHVKFIFATTEARKIPVTILSRCQRFDLRRVPQDVLAVHLARVSEQEQASLTPEALSLLAQSAEGSVRDALSLLDQAIAHHGEAGAAISEVAVRSMLGLADRAQTAELLRLVLSGKAAEACAQFRASITAGADPLLALQDMLDFTHFVTRIKLTPEAAKDLAYSEFERRAGSALAEEAPFPALARVWQMSLKGLQEARFAPSPAMAVEMMLVRLCHLADLPTPEEAVKQWKAGSQEGAKAGSQEGGKSGSQEVANASPPVTIASFPEMIQVLQEGRHALLASQLHQFGSLVRFLPGSVALHMKTSVPRDFSARLSAALQVLTGTAWTIALEEAPGEPTLAEQTAAAKRERIVAASSHPAVADVMAQFPGAELVEVQ